MAMLANLVVLLIFYCKKGRVFSVAWKTALAVTILACGLFFIPNPLQERSTNLFSANNIDLLQAAYAGVPDNPTVDKLYDVELADDDSDASWLMRAGKWCVAVKLWTYDAATLLLGIGPGSLGISLDGGWLRALIETGILGMVTLLFLVRSLWRISPLLRAMLIVMAINMLMIDIYISYKVVAFLLFTAGCMMNTGHRRKHVQRYTWSDIGSLDKETSKEVKLEEVYQT